MRWGGTLDLEHVSSQEDNSQIPEVNKMQTNQVVSPPLPLPPGFTPEALKAWLTDIRLDGAPPAEMAGYCAQDWKRFVYAWGLATECRGTALELGANPYFTIKRFQRAPDAGSLDFDDSFWY
ncbi:MAG: hypothetical protein ABSE56_03610 [Bryobacteraceae bacterium]